MTLNRKKKSPVRIAAMLLIVSLMSGCAGQQSDGGETSPALETETGSITTALAYSSSDYENVKDEDLNSNWNESGSTIVSMDGDYISVEGDGATTDGSSLIITQAGTYVLSGTLENGQIVIEAPDDALVRIVLNGVDLHCEDSAAINCVTADKLVLILAEGTENFVSDGDSYVFPDETTDEPNAAIFSKQDLSINGTGSLSVTSNYNNGIGTKDDLIIVSGDIQVTAENHSIRGRDSVIVIDASLTLDAGNDGIQTNNDTDPENKGWIVLYGGNYSINAANDGIQAESSLLVYGGDFDIISGGGSANAPERDESEDFGNWGDMPDWNGEMPEMPEWNGEMPDMSEWSGEMPEMPGQGGTASPPDGGVPEGVNPERAEVSPTPGESVEGSEEGEVTDETVVETVTESFKAFKSAGDMTIVGGSFNIDSADDAFHSNGNITISGGSFNIATGDDAVHADGDLLVEGETVMDITTCYEGLEATNVTVSDGDISIDATDDGINAAGGSGNGTQGAPGAFGADMFTGGGDYMITINGGIIRITAAYDGLDSNGGITINGGELYISAAGLNAPGGDGALDCDGLFTINGGTVAGSGGTAFAVIGTSGSDINADGSQPVLNFQFTEAQAEGTVIELKDAQGKVIVGHTAAIQFKCIALSSPDMRDGESYTVYANGEEIYTVTLSGSMTSISDTGESVSTAMEPGGAGMGGGGRGGMPWGEMTRQEGEQPA